MKQENFRNITLFFVGTQFLNGFALSSTLPENNKTKINIISAQQTDTSDRLDNIESKLTGNLELDGPDLRLGINDSVGVGTKPEQRALTHGAGDKLIINKDGDFEGETEIQSRLRVTKNLDVLGTDLTLGKGGQRDVGSRTGQRALVHLQNDTLILNYAGDFEGGTRVQSRLAVSNSMDVEGVDLTLGKGAARDVGSNTAQRALVHGNNDVLIVNYNGDFEGGTKVSSDLTVTGTVYGNISSHVCSWTSTTTCSGNQYMKGYNSSTNQLYCCNFNSP